MDFAIGGVGAYQLLALLLIGGIAGVLGGLLGIGGGLVMIPAMVLLLGEHCFGDNSFHLYKLAALTTAIVLSIRAAQRHAQANAIVYPMIKSIIALGLLGAVVGVAVASFFANEMTVVLRRTFGGFMLAAVAINIWRSWRLRGGPTGPDRCPLPSRWMRIGTIVGFPAGVIAGLLGVGGGVWAVPAQNFVLGVRLPNAIANSSCMIAGLAAGAALLKAVSIAHLDDPQAPYWRGLWLAVWLAPGATIGGWFGAKLTHELPVHWIRNVFYALLVITGLRLLAF